MTSKSNSSKATKKGRNVQKKVHKKGNKKRGHKRQQSFATHIYKVLKQVHPDTGISSKAMNVVNCFSNDILDRLARQAGELARYQQRRTIIKKDAENAVNLVIPGELRRHALSEGIKALTKYMSSK